jgi:enoyl-CoA hydratase/carnithine racemase
MTHGNKVLLEIQDSIALITLNKPDRLNALDVGVWRELEWAAESVEADQQVRAAILTGAGDRAFCAGLDLKEGSTLKLEEEFLPAAALPKVHRHLQKLRASFDLIENLHVPVIAAIKGHCIGGGMELICCCDIRIGSEDSRFSIPEVRLGIVPDMGGTQRLPKIVGIGKAKELIYSARSIDAREALRIGLLNEVCPKEKVMEQAFALAREIAANAPLAVQAAKKAINGGWNQTLAAGLAIETSRAAEVLISEDARGIRCAGGLKKGFSFKGR